MVVNFSDIARAAVNSAAPQKQWGRVASIDTSTIKIEGLQDIACIGDSIYIGTDENMSGDVVAVDDKSLTLMLDHAPTGVSPNDKAFLKPAQGIRPCDSWVGRILAADGKEFYGGRPPQGARLVALNPDQHHNGIRRGMGPRLNTSLAAFDTFLPICRGQRLGLFAGSGVGKSTLIGDLAKHMEADVVVVALIGERSREVQEFVTEVLGPEGQKRSIVFASTCNEPAAQKRRCALSAVATAEYFRDKGQQVLLLFDSITRFADAHRETALTAGETPSLRAYPPSTFRAIASLAERTGPGVDGAGDITAIFSVLVAGSDMEEPIADMVRGILDGHVVMDREIAERGRFPAINIRRSVSRSLPKAASPAENDLIHQGRRLIGAHDDAAALIQTGLYVGGTDPLIDRSIDQWPMLEDFIGRRSASCAESFSMLKSALGIGDTPHEEAMRANTQMSIVETE